MAEVTFNDIEQAAQQIAGEAVVTPLLRHDLLDEMSGGQIFIKPECLQRTGSFKFRGAWNFISRLDPSDNPGGVVAYSSGNHAQGVAAAAQLRGISAVIVMPEDTPQIKIANTKSLGAKVQFYDRDTGNREAIAGQIAAETGAQIVPPFEHRWIIAGQGTVGLELALDVADKGLTLDAMCVCTGGGGLTAGIAVALQEKMPGCKVYSVEPENFNDTARSLKAGNRVSNTQMRGSICDALLSPEPGELAFSLSQPLLAGGLVVSDEEVMAAMRFAFTRLKLVVEPGGAAALAAILSGKIACRGKTVGLTLSGGNADPALYSQILAQG